MRTPKGATLRKAKSKSHASFSDVLKKLKFPILETAASGLFSVAAIQQIVEWRDTRFPLFGILLSYAIGFGMMVFLSLSEGWKARAKVSEISEVSLDRVKAKFEISNPEDSIQGYFAKGVFYEPRELQLLGDQFTRGIFVDVGANVGNPSIYMAKLNPSCKVIAFEPHPLTFSQLKQNIAINRLEDQIEIFNIGLGASIGEFDLLEPNQNSGGTTMSGKIRGGHQSTRSVGKARVESGDCVLEGREVTLIKIDVEGFELQVLKGLERLIEAKRPKLLIETDELNGDEIERFLSKFGYKQVDEFRQYRALVNRFYVASNNANAQERKTMC